MNEASFEENLKQLEECVRKLEDGELPLQETLATFEYGLKLSQQCTEELNSAQKKIEKLVQVNGEVKSEPMEGVDE